MDSVIADVVSQGGVANTSYVQKPEDSFNEDLVEAIAEGRGPDVVLLDHRDLLRHRAKIAVFPFESVSERDYTDTFIDGAQIFWTPEGYIGLPFSVDPMVMYWNKSIFINEGLIRAPLYWDEFANLALKITKKDASSTISRSLVGFGEYTNVIHAKDIVSMLMIQAGTPLVAWGSNGFVQNYLTFQNREGLRSADVALRFYTEFADPAKAIYSWDRSLPNSQKGFVSGTVGIYFGFASEVESIRKANPNLNFDVALVPQIRDGLEKSTYARFSSASVLKTSRNIQAAYGVASLLTSIDSASVLLDSSLRPPVFKDMIAKKPLDPYKVVFYDQ